MRIAKLVLTPVMAYSVLAAAGVSAQTAGTSELGSLEGDALVGELTKRYDAALAASVDERLTAANDSRHLWALETKVQCAIALGYMKSSTRDEPSISKCARAYDLMNRVPEAPRPAPQPPAPPQRRPNFCADAGLTTVFFEFDSIEIQTAAASTLSTVAQQAEACNWTSLAIVGHTDQAGSDQYNLPLSQRRAEAVAAALRSKVPARIQISVDAKGESNPRVPLSDGTRSPENRRVEITAK